MNRNCQTRLTIDEIRRNTEIQMTNEPLRTRAPFDIRVSGFIRHSTTGSWSQCTASTLWRLSMTLLFGVPVSAGQGRIKAGLRTDAFGKTAQ
jgi:hypothetical protein